ncbi:MAG: TIGR04076 family protein [Chloroflexi bacterium]|nr:TIGR04076 family protein [Chloroflexota bacterium]
MAEYEYRVTGRVSRIKGTCSAGHKEGDEFDFSSSLAPPLCAGFFHDIWPWVQIFRSGGSLPYLKDPDFLVLQCPDFQNCLRIELRRIKQAQG